MPSRVSGLFLLSLLSAALVSLFSDSALAGTTGKLSGRILDDKKQPLPGVTLLVVGTHLGALTDPDGRYSVVNVPAGTYQVKVQLLGYRPVTVTDVHVSPDKTTSLDLTMQESPVEMKEVVVSGKSPVVDVRQTGTIASISKDEIAHLPVQELQDVVNLQAGVVDGHFRGGRSDEVQFQVDGVSVNNSYDNKSTLRIDRSLLEEVQVISGTFDAEYGQAMSGVVNAVLKRGSEKVHWDAETFGGGFFYPGDGEQRGLHYKLRPTGVQNYQISASGPTGIPRTLFLGNFRRYVFDDYAYGLRLFRPTDKSDFANGILLPTGDRETVPLGFSREWSGVGKITNRSWNNIEIGYQAIFNVINARRAGWEFRFNPDGLSRQKTYSIVHGLDWTHTLSKKAFYNLSLRQNYFNYDDRAYDDLWDARYDSAGAPTGTDGFEHGAIIQGVSFTRFHQNTNALVFKGSFVNQVTNDQQMKAGFEFQLPRLEFGSPGYLVYASGPNGL